MYICVDFDGTIVTHKYPEIGNPVSGAIKYLKEIQKNGGKIILFTMRSGQYLQDAVNYIQSHDIALYGVNTNPDQKSWTTSPKAYGHVYVDDAAFGCPLIHPPGARPFVNWYVVGPNILSMLNSYA